MKVKPAKTGYNVHLVCLNGVPFAAYYKKVQANKHAREVNKDLKTKKDFPCLYTVMSVPIQEC